MKRSSIIFSLVSVLIVLFVESNATSTRKENTFYGINEDLKKSSYNNELALQSIISKGTKFYLFSKETGETYTEIIYGNVSSVVNSAFGFKKTTKVIIHGWPDSAFGDFQTVTRKASIEGAVIKYPLEYWGSYFTTLEMALKVPERGRRFAKGSEFTLKHERYNITFHFKAYLTSSLDVNIIAVDWSRLSLFAKYAFLPVGKFVGSFLDWMVTDAGVSLDLLHVMGHSVGAQIAGMVGEHVSVGKVARITGMDPALGFGSSTSGRLDSTDAQFVDVMHTCGGLYSYFEPCGDVDFYPNRGHYNQPGCVIDFGLCSHLRAYRLYAESISSSDFVSRACDSWKHYVSGVCDNNGTAIMGELVNISARGNFYLHTAGSSPYALGNDTGRSH